MSGALLAKALGFAVLLAAAQAAQAAGADLGQLEKQPTNWTAIGMFAALVVATLFITKGAAAKTKSEADFYTAGGPAVLAGNQLTLMGVGTVVVAATQSGSSSFYAAPPVTNAFKIGFKPVVSPSLLAYWDFNDSSNPSASSDKVSDRTGEFLGSTPKLIGRAFYNQYTVLILATWHRTDITAPPVAGQ